MPIRRHNKEHLLAADLPQEGFREASNDAKHGISHLSPALVAAVRASLVKKYQEAQVSVARCVNEPLCIAFGTSRKLRGIIILPAKRVTVAAIISR